MLCNGILSKHFLGEFPWMVAIMNIAETFQKYHAGGSLIHPKIVLTGTKFHALQGTAQSLVPNSCS